MDGKGMEDFAQTGGEALEGAGMVTAAAGAYSKSKADQAAYNTQATVAENNSALAKLQAQDALQRGQQQQVTAGLKTRQLQGRQAAMMAANGVDLSSGSALNILSDTEFMGANDAGVIARNAAREAWGFNVQAQNYEDNAKLLHERADMESPSQAATTSLLTDGGQVARRWYSSRHPYADNS